MKLLTYSTTGATHANMGRGGVLLDDTTILDIARLGTWAARQGVTLPAPLPQTVLDVLRQPDGMSALATALVAARHVHLDDLRSEEGLVRVLNEVSLRSPIPEPPSIRDFYTFEQHVRAARARRGAEMNPDWYKVAVFYFSNASEVYGTDEPVPYPHASNEVDFELEMAAVIGREGRDIPADEAPGYIAGYMVMNDWSARDLWRQEQSLNMGPAKGKDYAMSLGPWLVTPDELADKRLGSGKDERYDLEMRGWINDDQLSQDNAKNMYYTFPQMIERASQHVRMRPGDIIGSGTCGTGCILELGTERHPWLRPGDVARMEIERLGTLANTLASPEGGR